MSIRIRHQRKVSRKLIFKLCPSFSKQKQLLFFFFLKNYGCFFWEGRKRGKRWQFSVRDGTATVHVDNGIAVL